LRSAAAAAASLPFDVGASVEAAEAALPSSSSPSSSPGHNNFDFEEELADQISPGPDIGGVSGGAATTTPTNRPTLGISNNSTSSSNNSTSRRQLLVRVGSWMKHSWRSRSNRSLASLSSAASFGYTTRSGDGGDGDGVDAGDDDDDINNSVMKVPKHVQFEEGDFLEVIIHDDNDDCHCLEEGKDGDAVDANEEETLSGLWFEVRRMQKRPLRRRKCTKRRFQFWRPSTHFPYRPFFNHDVVVLFPNRIMITSALKRTASSPF
jgi:hypothetical protein